MRWNCLYIARRPTRKIRGLELNELLQDNQHRLKALEEGHSVLNTKIERSHERLEHKFDSVALAIDGINNSLNQFLLLNKQAADFEKYCEEKDEDDKEVQKLLHDHDVKITQLVETRGWILVGLGLIISAVLVALIAMVIK